jgi:cell division protein FtsB
MTATRPRRAVVLINAVNEQQVQIDQQQKEINELKEVIKNLRHGVDALNLLTCIQSPAAEICRRRN